MANTPDKSAIEDCRAPRQGAFWMTGTLWDALITALLADRVTAIEGFNVTPQAKGRSFNPSADTAFGDFEEKEVAYVDPDTGDEMIGTFLIKNARPLSDA